MSKDGLKMILKQSGAQSGISLVETIVAIAILGLVGAIFVGGLSAGSISTRLQGEEVIARNLAQSQMEILKAADYDISGASYTAITTPADYSVAVSTNSAIYADSNIQKLTVTVNYGGSPVLTLEDYKVNR